MKKFLGLVLILIALNASAGLFYSEPIILVERGSGGTGDVNGTDANFHFVWAEHFFFDANAISGLALDGGFANSVYLPTQNVDGGNA